MTERRRRPTPLELTIDETLLVKHVVAVELHSKELEEVIGMLIEHMLQQSGVTEAETPTVGVSIVQDMATVQIVANIKKPVKASFIISYVLLNSFTSPGELSAKNILIDIQAGFLAKAAIKTQMVEEKIKYALNNISDTIMKNPPPIMQEHGQSFSQISLTLENDRVAVQLTSE